METTDSLEHSAPGLLRKLQAASQAHQFSPRTAHSYQHWISRYLFFHDLQSPEQLDERNVKDFLSYLATSVKVSPAKQNQARSALDFLYTEVLNKPMREINGFVKAHKPRRFQLVRSGARFPKQGNRNPASSSVKA